METNTIWTKHPVSLTKNNDMTTWKCFLCNGIKIHTLHKLDYFLCNYSFYSEITYVHTCPKSTCKRELVLFVLVVVVVVYISSYLSSLTIVCLLPEAKSRWLAFHLISQVFMSDVHFLPIVLPLFLC